MIIIAIHLFSKKLEDMECEIVEEAENIEEIEPLPQYQEREIVTEAEVNLSNYIQSNNTINTIPRDTMNIINRLNNEASRDQYARIYDQSNSNNDHIEDEEEEPRPSTSTIPVPLPEKENMPRIPPPCYDVALTQPRISTKGMIVLPQDPSFSILPFLSRNSSTIQYQSIRRNRERLRDIFVIHRHHSNSSNNNSSPNNYRFQDSQITSSLSTSSHSSNSSDHSTTSETNALNHHRRRDSSRRSSRSRLIFGHQRHSHIFRRNRRSRLRSRQSTDNISVSSISVYYPTSVIDIPEDHYSIETHANDSIRNYRAPSYISERNSPPTTTTINGGQDPELSLINQHLLSNISEYGTSTVQSHQASSLEVLHGNESWYDIPPPTPTPSIQHIDKAEIIQTDSVISVENNLNNVASTSQTPSDCINIDVQSNNNNSHQITIHSNFDLVHSNTNNTNYHNTNEHDTVINDTEKKLTDKAIESKSNLDKSKDSSKKDNRQSTISINILNPDHDITKKKLNREMLRKIKSEPVIDAQEVLSPIPNATPTKSKKSKSSNYSSFLPSFTSKSKHLSIGPKEVIVQDSASVSSECSSSSSVSIPIASPSLPSSPKRNINTILSSISQSTNLSSFKQMQKKLYSSVALLPSKKEKVSRKGKEKLDWDSSELSIKIETETSFSVTEIPGEIEDIHHEIIVMPSTIDITDQKEKMDLFEDEKDTNSDFSNSKSKSIIILDDISTSTLEKRKKKWIPKKRIK